MQKPKELAFGGAMADQLARIKRGLGWDVKAFQGVEQGLAEVLLHGYQTIVWPKWLTQYELIDVEKECPQRLSEWLTYNSRPDTIMRRKSDGSVWYGPEDKTTGWVDSLLNYAKNVQLHATALGIEKVLGERVAGCLVQGLYKGYEKQGEYYHPFLFAYCKDGVPGIMPDQWSDKYTRAKGWERTGTEHFKGGRKAWVDKLAKERELNDVFPMSEPVMLHRPLAERYLAQVLLREEEIEGWRQRGSQGEELDRVFPQHFNQCEEFSKSRKPCWAKELCFNPTIGKFPMSVFKVREPHHENEKADIEGRVVS